MNSGINRYIAARGFEWNNQKSFIFGLTETIIYSGNERKIDFSYFNPINSHLEVELNNRLMYTGTSNSNAVWQFHLDWMFHKNKRISVNYLYDELVLDRDIEIGKEHGRAYSFSFNYTPLYFSDQLATFFIESIFIGTPTFRHGNGSNNFVLMEKPLGWQGGSDLIQYSIGLNYYNNLNLFLFLKIGVSRRGEESISNRPYETYFDYLKDDFPSGNYNEEYFFEIKINWWSNQSILFKTDLTYYKKRKNLFSLEAVYLF